MNGAIYDTLGEIKDGVDNLKRFVSSQDHDENEDDDSFEESGKSVEFH